MEWFYSVYWGGQYIVTQDVHVVSITLVCYGFLKNS